MLILNEYCETAKAFLLCGCYSSLGVLLHIVRQHKRSKALTALFFPTAAALFLIGWSLSWIGSQKSPRKTLIAPAKDHVHLTAIPIEEKAVITK
jgi:hypothetical protein